MKEKLHYTIYQVTNTINGKIYVGKHQTKDPLDSYYGSGKYILKAIKKYGKENFEKHILFDFETEVEMNAKEKEILTEEFISNENNYNAGVGGEGGPHFKGKQHSEESKKKMGHPGRKMSIEEKSKVSERLRGRPVSPETRKKLADALKQYHKRKKL